MFTLTNITSMESVGWLRGKVWQDAGFGSIRDIRKDIEDYEPWFEPTVIPVPGLQRLLTRSSTWLSANRANPSKQQCGGQRQGTRDITAAGNTGHRNTQPSDLSRLQILLC